MSQMLWNEIEQWVLQGIEGTKIELKREFPLSDRIGRAKLAKLITAMANAAGGAGYFIIGVKDKKERKPEDSLDEIIYGVNELFDEYQKLIYQALDEFANPVPRVIYEEVTPPGIDKKIGVIIIERSRERPHEITKECEKVKPGIYLKRGGETFSARREDIMAMALSSKDQWLLINFTHPVTDEQIKQIEEKLKISIVEIVQPPKIPIHFNENEDFATQISTCVNGIGLTDEQWQDSGILVNVPGMAPIATALVAELHGRMGHFPSLIRLKRSENNPSNYEFAEVMHLQHIRDKARARHQS